MGNHFQRTIAMLRFYVAFPTHSMLPSSLNLTPTHLQIFKFFHQLLDQPTLGIFWRGSLTYQVLVTLCCCSFYQRFTQIFVSTSDKTVLGFFYVAWQYRKECYKSVLTLQAPATQNGQTHSDYCRRIVEVCLIILWGWRLKSQPIFMPLTSFYIPIKHQKTSV